MEKTSPAPGNGWSLGLMSAIALFGVSSAFMVLHQPAPEGSPALPPVAAVSQPATQPMPPAEAVEPGQPLPATPMAAATATAPTAESSAVKNAAAEKPAAALRPAPKPSVPAKREKSREATTRLVEESVPKLPKRAEPAESASESAQAVEGKVRVLDQAPTPQASAPAPAAPAPAAPAVNEAAQGLQTTKAVIAEPLVKAPFKPKVVMANAQRVWVKLDEQQTLIFDKGQKVPHFGMYQGFDGKTAQFDTGSIPLSATE